MALLGRLAWGGAIAMAGVVVAAGWAPGASSWAVGPRIGIATLLVVLGLVVASLALAPWIVRRTARPENQGTCPVGATCACGHFNFKPRQTCRQCGVATAFAS